MDKIIKTINTYVSLTKLEIEYLKEAITKKVYQKNELIFSQGKISNEIYFVNEGCVRLFYNVDGKDKTAFFYTSSQYICAGESYTYNIPATENYQAMSPTELYVMAKPKIEQLLKKVPKMEIIARVATENELITCQKLIACFITKSPEERYVDLLETQGKLFQQVPQQYIASYLGVSPETLSRIKKRILDKSRS